jgi:hypothetical protein
MRRTVGAAPRAAASTADATHAALSAAQAGGGGWWGLEHNTPRASLDVVQYLFRRFRKLERVFSMFIQLDEDLLQLLELGHHAHLFR